MTSIFSSNLNAINGTSTFGGTLFGNSLSTGVYGSPSGLFGGNTYGSSGMYGSNFGYGGYGYFGNTFGSYFGNTGYGSLWGRTTTPTTDDDTVNRTTTLSGTTIATKSVEEEGTLDFATNDFTYTNGDAVASLQIVDLPDNGTLYLGNAAIGLNQIIPVGSFDDISYGPDLDFDQTDTFSVLLSTDGVTYDTTNSNVSVSVVGSNDAPGIDSLSRISVEEGTTASTVGAAIAGAFTDPDTGDTLNEVELELDASVSGSSLGVLTYTSDYGSTITLTHGMTATLSADEVASLSFIANEGVAAGNSSVNETAKIEFEVTDQSGEISANAATLNIQITDGNDAPTFKSGLGFTAIKVEENSIDDDFAAFPAEDEENPYELTYSITGVDAHLFNVDSSNGNLTFKNAPDREDYQGSVGDDKYAFTLFVADPEGETASTEVQIEVTNVVQNLSMTIGSSEVNVTTTSASNVVVEVDENENVALTATMSNSDTGNAVSFSIDGGDDEDLFTIDEDTGVLSFLDEPDAENPHDSDEDGVYDVTVVLTDEYDEDGVGPLSIGVEVTVNDVHDNEPQFEGVSLNSDITGTTVALTSSTEGSISVKVPEDTNATSLSPLRILDIVFNNGEVADALSTDNYALGDDLDLTFTLTSSAGTSNFSVAPASSGSPTAVISIKAGAEFDADDSSYRPFELTLTVTDEDDDLVSTTDISVSLDGVNEAPIFTMPNRVGVELGDEVNVGESIVGSMDDPEKVDLSFRITEAKLNGSTSIISTLANSIELVYYIDGVDHSVDVNDVLTYDEAETLSVITIDGALLSDTTLTIEFDADDNFYDTVANEQYIGAEQYVEIAVI